MPERPSKSPEQPRETRSLYGFSTILGVKIDEVELSRDAEEMAGAYIAELQKNKTNSAGLAELAFAFRRQLMEDLKSFDKASRYSLLQNDESHAFSLAIYRKLLSLSGVTKTLQTELARHQKEKDEINGTYETYKEIERSLEDERGKLIALLSEMFKRAGQEAKPIHLARRAILESKISDLEGKLEAVKKQNPDVGALIEYDTIKQYADQLRTTGFIWTKSRQKLLQDVLQGALTSRPVAAMMGETGTGKTALARAASLELSSKEPERTVGGDQEKFVRLLASPAIEAGKTYYEYGPLLRAMTGRSSSIDDSPSKGGGIFFDDEFNTRPTSVQRQILKFVSEARAGRKVAIPGTPLTVVVEPGFLYLAAGNPPSERYEREETGIETKREFVGNVINVEYLEQTKDNPELYQILLASLLDQKTGRLTAVTREEVEPHFVKDAATGQNTLDEDPLSHGYLLRFANCWGELYKAFSHQDTVLHKKHPGEQKVNYYLSSFVLDAGVVFSWMDQYKASPKDRKKHLGVFLKQRVNKYFSQFPQDEQKIVKKYLDYFKIDETAVPPKPKAQVLTPKDIGYLNPNVERPKGKGAPPSFEAIDFIDPGTGEISLQYVARDVGQIVPGTRLTRTRFAPASMPHEAVLLGVFFDPGTKQLDMNRIAVKGDAGAAHTMLKTEFLDWFEIQTPHSPPEAKELTPFAYDRIKASEYGFSEMKIEKHEKAHAIIDAVYARDPRFVTLHKKGSPDPDSTTTPQATLAQDKHKVIEQALKDAWIRDCSDLPNTPDKSLWYFQALAEHRLSNTIDSVDPNNLNNPTRPHIPNFNQREFLLAMDFAEFNFNNDLEKQAALTPQTKKILKLLFNKEDPTSITRDEVNTALWTDHEARTQSPKAKEVILELLGQNINPDDFELRLMRPDEYARAASLQNYGQKNLWTYFDGYYAHGDGHRFGLLGGYRGVGGAARVDGFHRGYRGGDLGVRLVLSRRNP